MLEKTSFHKNFDTDIIVANIGINREEWFCYKPGDDFSKILALMVKEKYDIVPSLNKRGDVAGYLYINEDEELKSTQIEDSHKLYYRTHIHDVIWKMSEEERDFYFLTHGRSGDNIIGLISLCNFNCREFYIYLFSLLSFVERELATMITYSYEEAFKILAKRANNGELKNQLKSVEERFYEDQQVNRDNDFKEYLYLTQLLWLLCEQKGYKNLNYNNEASFVGNTSMLKEIRNNVAHPVRSLVRNHKDLKNLRKGLDKLYELKSKIENYKLSKLNA